MSGEENIKLAIRHLERAIAEKTRGIQTLTTDFDRQRKEMEHDVDRFDRDINRSMAMMGGGNANSARKAVILKHITELKEEKDERKQQITNLHNSVKDQIKSIEHEIASIQQKISSMQSIS